MKIPQSNTIRSKVHVYASKVGLRIEKNVDGSYNMFDIPMDYYTHKNVNMSTVVRVVTDELYARAYREASLVVGV